MTAPVRDPIPGGARPDQIMQNIESIAEFYQREDQKVNWPQRSVERLCKWSAAPISGVHDAVFGALDSPKFVAVVRDRRDTEAEDSQQWTDPHRMLYDMDEVDISADLRPLA